MTNGQIIDILETTASLLELHNEDQNKIKALQNAVFKLDKLNQPLFDLSSEEINQLEGIGKSIANRIEEIIQTGTTQELGFYLSSTPEGVMEMLGINGIGPKKVRTLWKELEIDNLESLRLACLEGKVEKLKGFGEKTQDKVLHSVEFILGNRGKFLYSEAEDFAFRLEEKIKELLPDAKVSISGDIRRKMEVVSFVQLIVGSDNRKDVLEQLNHFPWLEKDEQQSSPFNWRGKDRVLNIAVEIKPVAKKDFTKAIFLHSAGKNHLTKEAKEGISFLNYVKQGNFSSEKEIYESLSMAYILPEQREGLKEIEQAKENKLPTLLEVSDLKGTIHNHSKYSDGKNTLEEMAIYAKELGYEYLGITDHSKSAGYANGLPEFRVRKQQEEIEVLNKKLSPFKIFKGIESDILTDGSLDYEDDVLKSFDFIVASIHSGFSMDEEKATQRIIKAVENPYTTMLGHLTGRLLLRREGYPVNHRKIIDACADNKVIIEINANPLRLDIDWRWVDYALEKGVYISINPDAHNKEGYHHVKYGVNVGRKAGLTAAMTFNAWSLEKVENWFNLKKK